ncbi:MAG: dTDP-4-amino-4,6-dideoxygalactose transaminase [Candidatus Deianiraeaceae bacterium]|jgi:dTDP-4-amino-4,6-dideoxygalactose transaminase
MKIPFNKSNHSENTIRYITEAFQSGHTSGDGKFTKLCNNFLESKTGAKSALITHSCTAALEMSAIMLNANIDDEVIMPSYTFVSTANAFVLRGLVPVFVDIRQDSCNIDEQLIEQEITPKTKAIVPVHYAGVACEMDTILRIAKKYNLMVIEDAAQAYGSYYKGKHLGSIGEFGTLSFHETKNIISGEGGALLINNEKFIDRSHIIREKGTNRTQFCKGQVDKYTWVDVGSSYLPSDVISAYLYSNLEIDDVIQKRRLEIWQRYYDALKQFEGKITLPFINDYATNNAHMFYIRFCKPQYRDDFILFMKEKGIMTPFHYIPLHSSPAGVKYGRVSGEMTNTNVASQTLVRLPLYFNLKNEEVEYIISCIYNFLQSI